MALKYQIGVDAGGTHSTAIAYDENGKELGRPKAVQVKLMLTTKAELKIFPTLSTNY